MPKRAAVQSKAEKFSVWSGSLNTAGGISCYGTLEGYLKCVDAKDITKELFKFKTPSGIIGNVFTYEHKGKQHIGVFSGIGGWAGIGMAALHPHCCFTVWRVVLRRMYHMPSAG